MKAPSQRALRRPPPTLDRRPQPPANNLRRKPCLPMLASVSFVAEAPADVRKWKKGEKSELYSSQKFQKRTMQSMQKHRSMKRKKDRKNCTNEPLFQGLIEVLDHVMDVMHWFGRACDTLLKMLISEVRELDKIAQILKFNTFNRELYTNCATLGRHMSDIGVRFRFSVHPEMGKLCYTSLSCAEKRPLCAKITFFICWAKMQSRRH